jgi:hypothetical protein
MIFTWKAPEIIKPHMKQAHTNIRSEIDVELGRSFSGALNITLMIRMLSEPLCCILLQNDLMVYLPDCFFGLSVSIKKKKRLMEFNWLQMSMFSYSIWIIQSCLVFVTIHWLVVRNDFISSSEWIFYPS